MRIEHVVRCVGVQRGKYLNRSIGRVVPCWLRVGWWNVQRVVMVVVVVPCATVLVHMVVVMRVGGLGPLPWLGLPG